MVICSHHNTGRGTMPRSLPTLEHDGFCLRHAGNPAQNPAQGATPGALCLLLFELGFVDQNGLPFTHQQALWVVIRTWQGNHWRGVLLQAPFLFVQTEDELLAIGTELPFLPCHIVDVLPEADLGPAERSLASRPPQRAWAA